MASKTQAVEAVETVEAVDEALANGTVEQGDNEKQAAVIRLLNRATRGAPPAEQRPLPGDVMNDFPLVQDARMAVEQAEEHVAALEQEQSNIATAQIDAGAMASNPAQFRELRARWSEIGAEIYVAKVTVIHAKTALIDAQIAALEEGLPALDERLRELNAQIAALQAQAAPLANDGYRRGEMIKNLRGQKPALATRLGNLEHEWATQLRAQLPAHMRDAIRR